MQIHWHLAYSNKTACGLLAYKTTVQDEYDTPVNGRLECSRRPDHVTCKSCRRIMLLDTADGTLAALDSDHRRVFVAMSRTRKKLEGE